MSEPEPHSRNLEGVLEELAGRGYLRPTTPLREALPRVLARWLALAGGLAVALAGAAVAAARAEFGALPPLVVGFLPAALVAVVGCSVCGRALSRLLLRAGGQPEIVASLMAAVAGVLVTVALVAVAAWGTARRPALMWLTGLVGVAMGVAVTALVRERLARHLAFRASPQPRSRAPWWAFMVVVLGGGALALIGAVRRPASPPESTASFPPPSSRLAVYAVDGLSHEDLEAAAAMSPTPGLAAVASWGWAPLKTDGARLPAVLWTTIASGVSPAVHGVEELDEVRLFGLDRGVPLGPLARAVVFLPWKSLGLAKAVARPALDRRAPTFWEMASRAGYPISVGGWWGSWPVRRMPGDVASERAWLAGAVSADAVSADLIPLVEAAWKTGGDAATASDALGEALARRAAGSRGARLLAVSMPGADLVERADRDRPPVVSARLVLDHLRVVGEAVEIARSGAFTVFVVGVPWRGGTAFVASSAAGPGEHPEVEATELASTWLDALALPASVDSLRVRRDLSGATGPAPSPVSYGPPPPPLASPPPAALATQREVLRSLGYLQ